MAFIEIKKLFLLVIMLRCVTLITTTSLTAEREEFNEIRRTKTRPNQRGPPVIVGVSVFLNQIFSVDIASMTLGVDLYLREQWEDERVGRYVTENVILALDSASAFWTPDTFFQNQIIGSLPSIKQGYIHIRSQGHLKSEKRMSVVVSCLMDLRMFPFDTQSCTLILESYAFSNDDLLLKWVRKDINPPYNMSLVGYTVTSTSTAERTRHYTTGNYSELLACIIFRRNVGHYGISIFFPVSAVVVVAWMLSWDYNNARFAEFVVLIVFILSFHTFFRFHIISAVSYITLTDLYMLVCFLLTFSCACKVLLWKYLLRADGKESTTTTASEAKKKSTNDLPYAYSVVPSWKQRSTSRISLAKPERPYRVIHVISHLFLLIILCVCFILLVLWPTVADGSNPSNNCL